MNLTQKYALEVANEMRIKYDTEADWDKISHEFGGTFRASINPSAILSLKEETAVLRVALADARLYPLKAPWQPINTAPKAIDPILIFINDGASQWQEVAYWHSKKNCWLSSAMEPFDEKRFKYIITHWMPLPDAPRATA